MNAKHPGLGWLFKKIKNDKIIFNNIPLHGFSTGHVNDPWVDLSLNLNSKQFITTRV